LRVGGSDFWVQGVVLGHGRLSSGVGGWFGAWEGSCGPVLGLGVKGFGFGRGGFGDVFLGFGAGQVGFAKWCGEFLGSLGYVRAWAVRFRGLRGCLGFRRVCADRFWAWVVGRVLGLGAGFWGCGFGGFGGQVGHGVTCVVHVTARHQHGTATAATSRHDNGIPDTARQRHP